MECVTQGSPGAILARSLYGRPNFFWTMFALSTEQICFMYWTQKRGKHYVCPIDSYGSAGVCVWLPYSRYPNEYHQWRPEKRCEWSLSHSSFSRYFSKLSREAQKRCINVAHGLNTSFLTELWRILLVNLPHLSLFCVRGSLVLCLSSVSLAVVHLFIVNIILFNCFRSHI